MVARFPALRLPTSQAAIGLLLGVSVGLLYLLYENWTRAGILFMAAGAGVVGVVLLSRPFFLLLIMSAGLTGSLQDLIPGFSMPTVLYACLAGLIFVKFIREDYSWRITPVVLVSILYVAWYLTTLAWMQEFMPIGELYISQALVSVGIMLCISELVRSPEQWKLLMSLIGLGIVITAISSVIGLYTFVTQGIDLSDASAASKLNLARYFGHWGGPNALAHTVGPFTPLFVPYLNRHEQPRTRIAAAIVLFCGVLAVAMTLSRAGILALTVALIVVCAVSRYRYVLLFSAVAVVLIATMLLPVNLMGRLSLSSFGRADASVNERTFVARSAVEIIQDNLPAGAGFSGFNFYYGDYMERTAKVYHAHNAYLHVLAEAGIPGLILFLAVFGVLLLGLSSVPNGIGLDSVASELRLALIAVVFSILIAAVFEHNFGWLPHWFLFALAGIYPHVFGEPATPAAA